MVFFYTTSEGYTIYMGADKYENEGGDLRNPLNHFLYDNLSCLLADLIKYGIPEDIWFHVDDMSSAHVYLRLNKNQRLEGKI